MKSLGWRGALVLAALCWGGSATFTKTALGSMQPMTLLAVQLAASAVVLWAVLLIRGGPLPRPTVPLVLLGVLEPALSYAFFTFGLLRTTASNASLLTALESFFAIGLACLFLRERLTGGRVAALVLALAGVLALEGGGGGSFAPRLGDALVLIGVLCAATYVLLASRVAEEVDALTLTAYQFGFALLCVLPIAVTLWITGVETPPTSASPSDWGAAALSGVGGYALSFLLYHYAIASVTPTTAAMVLNLIPVFGLACAVLFLGEELTAPRLIGAALILAAVVAFSREPEPKQEEHEVPQHPDRNRPVGAERG
ncbi:DMT family transporter [Streptomyces sp. NPDC021093]|uniref:DMT family transporter n=1 Tax=Streptomyces sp. NPDC021093 TaxID=3365112 RepID=UPI0037BA6944